MNDPDPGRLAYEYWCRHARAYLPWAELDRSDRDAWRSFARTLAVDYGIELTPEGT